MFDDINDVEGEEIVVVHTDIVERPISRWTKKRSPHASCFNCSIRINILAGRKQNSCCGSSNQPHYYTASPHEWQQHLNEHVRMGEVVMEEDWKRSEHIN